MAVILSLLGYPILLMAQLNFQLIPGGSRSITVPIRLLIIFLLLVALITGRKGRSHPAVFWFLGFSLFYLGRIFFEWLNPSPALYQSPLEFFLYFFSFTLFPIFAISNISISRYSLKVIYLGLLWCSVIFTVLTIVFYGDFIGEVTRVSAVARMGGNYVSPLMLSYTSALCIAAFAVSFFSMEEPYLRRKWVMPIVIFLFIPFFLGASRGSVVSLGVVATFFFIFHPKTGRRVLFLVGASLIVLLGFLAIPILGDGVFYRTASIFEDIQKGSSRAVRIIMWQEGIEQFLESVFFGNSLQGDKFRGHPHNIIIEILFSTGAFGFFFFSVFLFHVFKNCVIIVRGAPEHSWTVAIFLTGFTSNMFSGSISSAVMTATGAGIAISLGSQIVTRRQRGFSSVNSLKSVRSSQQSLTIPSG